MARCIRVTVRRYLISSVTKRSESGMASIGKTPAAEPARRVSILASPLSTPVSILQALSMERRQNQHHCTSAAGTARFVILTVARCKLSLMAEEVAVV
jgi:hypothetical protein